MSATEGAAAAAAQKEEAGASSESVSARLGRAGEWSGRWCDAGLHDGRERGGDEHT